MYLKIILNCVTCMAIMMSANAQDFRDSKWGDSKSDVKSKEPSDWVIDDGNTLIKEVTIGGFDALAGFYFFGDTFYMGTYVLTVPHTNLNDHISDFKQIDLILQDKYGKKASVAREWKDDLYKDEEQQHGFAVSLGHYRMSDAWINGNTGIIHTLEGDNYEIKHKIGYMSMVLMDHATKAQKSRSLKDF